MNKKGKKARFGRIRRVFTSVFRFRFWSDYDRLKSFTFYLRDGIFRMFYIPDPLPEAQLKTFEEAVKAENLTEAQLEKRKQGLLRTAIIMFSITCCLFFYFIYHLFSLNILASIISLVLVLLGLTLTFRYHFWYVQIKERKLGLSFKNWWDYLKRQRL